MFGGVLAATVVGFKNHLELQGKHLLIDNGHGVRPLGE